MDGDFNEGDVPMPLVTHVYLYLVKDSPLFQCSKKFPTFYSTDMGTVDAVSD